MTMYNYRKILGYLFILLSIYPAAYSWPMGKIYLFLFLALGLLAKWHHKKNINALYSIFLFVTMAASFWLLFHTWIPRMPSWLVLLCWLVLMLYAIIQFYINNTQTVFQSENTNFLWPTKRYTHMILLLVVGGCMLGHGLLNALFDKPFHGHWWTSPTWAVLAFVLFYPNSLNDQLSDRILRLNPIALPLFIIIILAAHGYNYTTLMNQYSNNLNLENTIKKSFKIGYKNIGIRSVNKKTYNFLEQGNWKKAVTFMRQHWQFAPKEEYAKAWRKSSKKHHFFFLLCFGASLKLQNEEVLVDGRIDTHENKIHILTSKGRFIEINQETTHTLASIDDQPQSMTYTNDRYYVLSNKGTIYEWIDDTFEKRIDLPNQRVYQNQEWDILWQDLAVSNDHQKIWAMDDHGTIEQISYNTKTKQWDPQREIIYYPLWSEPNIAQKLVHYENRSFIILDQYGGVHWQGSDKKKPRNFKDKNLKKYYHPDKASKRDIAFWNNKNELIILNESGRLDFITSHYVEPNQDDRTDTFYDWRIDPIHSVRGSMKFNRQTARRYFPGGAFTLEPLPELESIAVIYKQGKIQWVTMPHGIRIEMKTQYAEIDVRQ